MSGMGLGESDCVPQKFSVQSLGSGTQLLARGLSRMHRSFCVLNELHEALKKSSKRRCITGAKENRGLGPASETSLIMQSFEGQMSYDITCITCLECKTSTDKPEIFTALSLPVPSEGTCSLQNHSGFLDGGHYTAFCKHSVTENWYSFDSQITKIPNSSVQTDSAYLLFYTCQAFSAPKESNKS
ncbi:inactive ubiquitin carboxyl-terminal hydrolase 50 [Cygnus atratus]|uniref:inactive ubiquitin carboxyl-terminal hydrolase 50 n=1 Tax=Cygnus atratus TaxID=8868 RepID=UPI0015D5CE8D|nr:inactive ubiquitin carboxyl-terminal hydrolase 50 [Cygnus atratus]